MSYRRSFSPYSPPMRQYPSYPPPMRNDPAYPPPMRNDPAYSYSTEHYGSQVDPYELSPNSYHHDGNRGTSYSELQTFCNVARETVTSSISPYMDLDNPLNDYRAPSSNGAWCGYNNLQFQQPQYVNDETIEDFEDGDEDGADWYDLEAMGCSEEKFDWAVPMTPVLPVSHLRSATFSGQNFFVDDEGIVQVYTQGECYHQFVQKPSIGVWFGPNHPSNVSERLHRGRQTQEAGRFAAVIEAIRVAGSYGIKQLQINTDYINVIRFMMYFIYKWEHNGWMTVKGTAVKNQILIRELDYFAGLLEVKWNYVPWEENAEGNLGAIQLARDALALELPTSLSSKSAEKKADSPNEEEEQVSRFSTDMSSSSSGSPNLSPVPPFSPF